MSCDCTQICIARCLGGDIRLCKPKDLYFTIARVQYVKGADGEAERDDVFFPQRYATLEAALAVVRTLQPGSRYVIDQYPSMGGPAWSGWPDQVPAVEDSRTNELVPTG